MSVKWSDKRWNLSVKALSMSMGEAIKHATVNEESDRAHIVE